MELAAYAGLFGATFLAATIIPFSSEAMLSGMILTGFDPVLSLIVATVGNFLGGMSSYGLGYLGKRDFINKYLRISNEKLDVTIKRIEGKEYFVSFFCWLPFIGDIIAVILGILRIKVLNVATGMFIGKALRYIVWAILTLNIKNYL